MFELGGGCPSGSNSLLHNGSGPVEHVGKQLPTWLVNGKKTMANLNESMAALLKIDGANAVAIVDSNSGMVLGKEGSGVNLDIAAAGNTEVVRAKLKTMKALNIKGGIEDILITLDNQYHVIRPIADKEGIFIYLVLDKAKSNLAMARFKVQEVEGVLMFRPLLE